MAKRLVSVLILISLALTLSSCSAKTFIDGVVALLRNAALGNDTSDCVFEPDGGDYVRLVECSVEGCGKYGRPKGDGKYTELFEEYLDYEDKKKEIFDFCDELLEHLKKAEKYDPEKHAYKEGSKLEEESRKASDMTDRLGEYHDYVSDVYSIVELFYYSDIEKYGDAYLAVEDFYDEFDRRYAEIEVACYECAYREYLFLEADGWTDEKIEDEIEEARQTADDEYSALVDEVQRISFEIDAVESTYFSSEIPGLMEELVEANNALARYLGYDDYFEYAWENEYSRDYTTEQAEEFTRLVKEYLAPVMWDYYDIYYTQIAFDRDDPAYRASEGSFVRDRIACDALYGFLKSIEKCQNKDDESYYDSANDAFRHGNILLSDSSGAYVAAYTDYLYGEEIPLMYFSKEYFDVQTFVHEHGHYHAALTGSSDSVSYDVNETQSQGAELLFTRFLKDYFDEKGYEGYDAVMTEMITLDLLSVVYTLADNEFEYALYTGDTDGIDDPDGLLADGVSSDEYDYLYDCILKDYGFEYGDSYWRNTVTKNPCYYVSYAVSMVASLEFYAEALNNGYEAGVKAYLKLFEFPLDPEYEDRDVSDVEYMCESAGIASPFEKEAFEEMARALESSLE